MTTLRTHPRSGRRTARGLLAALGAATVLLSGCGGGDSATLTGATTTPNARGSVPATTAAATASTASDVGTAAGDETPPAAGSATGDATTPNDPAPTGTGPVVVRAELPAAAAVLTSVRWANRGRYDRLVLDVSGPFGGYQVQYVDTLTEDPTGDPVELAGGAVLAVSIQGATRNNAFQTSGTTPLKTYGGPARVAPNLPNLKEVADAGDFEAVLTFGLGLDRKTGFRVMRLTGPDRLVVDVAH